MKEIYVVGESNQFEVYIASREERFSLRDYFFVIEEKEYLGEIVESFTFNKFFPRPDIQNERDQKIIEHLKILGFDIEKEDINIAKLKLLDEPPFPIKVGSKARRANFSEIKNIFKVEEKGLILGGIKNSDRFFDELPSKLKNLYKIIEDGKEREQREIPFVFTIEEMIQYPHIGIFGGSGSGKSFLLRVLIEEIAKFGYPAIIFDPHFEMSFSTLNEKEKGINEIIKNIKVFTVGEDTGIDFSEISERELENLFKSIGEIEIPQEDVIYNAYYMMGSEKSLSNFRENLLNLAQKSKDDSDKNITSRTSARAVLRKLSHLERLNIFGKSDRELLNWIKNEKIAVIQGSLETLKTFASFFLEKIVEKRKDYKDGEKRGEIKDYFPPFFVILDEAHNFAPKESIYFIPSKRVLKIISQEGRKYGIFLILSTQRPSLLDDTILAQLSTKFILRTVRETDLDTIRKETDLTNIDIGRLPYLKTGDAFVSSAIFQRSIPIRVRKTFTNPPPSKNPFLELKEKKEDKKEFILSYLKREGVIEEIFFERILREFESCGVIFKDINEIKIILNELELEGIIEKDENPITSIWRLKNVHQRNNY
ncbi:MAG: ATP-binding protein [Caldisericia bacterium]|nr:ATP-binding protein [Caldisericia bacterium]